MLDRRIASEEVNVPLEADSDLQTSGGDVVTLNVAKQQNLSATVDIFKKIKSIIKFFSGTSPYTISALLNVSLTKVNDWESGRDSPSKDQAQYIKKINSPLTRLKRWVSNLLALYFKKYFLLMSKNTIYPYQEDQSIMTNYLSTFRQNPKFIKAYAKGKELI